MLGYACSHRFRVKPAYQTSIEVSIYVDVSALGSGLGTTLYAALFAGLERDDLHRAYAGIALPNDASERLHEKLGHAVADELAGDFYSRLGTELPAAQASSGDSK